MRRAASGRTKLLITEGSYIGFRAHSNTKLSRPIRNSFVALNVASTLPGWQCKGTGSINQLHSRGTESFNWSKGPSSMLRDKSVFRKASSAGEYMATILCKVSTNSQTNKGAEITLHPLSAPSIHLASKMHPNHAQCRDNRFRNRQFV
jgi:hypothetical protein